VGGVSHGFSMNSNSQKIFEIKIKVYPILNGSKAVNSTFGYKNSKKTRKLYGSNFQTYFITS
jgi:hypothetical protein